jgi:hypothetical protein
MMKRKAIVTQKFQISKNSFRIRLQESYLTRGMFSEHMQKQDIFPSSPTYTIISNTPS